MKTVGIICEYNPFHLGHRRQLDLIQQECGPDIGIICLMSGNYVQRGVPAMWDKWTRARAALACGADLVLELPLTAVLQSAEGFARGGVDILTRLGCVDRLCFGVETDHAEVLPLLAARMDEPAALQALRNGLNQGLPYAAARQAALGDTENLLTRPNNILGFEYCRAILTLQSDLKPLMINRTGDYHAQEADVAAPSATAVRSLFPDGPWQQYLPEAAAAVLSSAPWYDLSFGERAVLARLRSLSDAQWEACAHGSEGLWSKVMKAARSCGTLETIAGASKSKRYPRTRIQRLLLCAYLGISDEVLHQPLPYVRALAATPVGCQILRSARKQGSIPICNAGERPMDSPYFRLEEQATDLFTLFATPSFPCPGGLERSSRIFLQK